ncbi:MAG: hypothetical protein LBB76_09265 [Azoarcus sp.]|nr:hypothetical protein [Azoarcus sp.]
MKGSSIPGKLLAAARALIERQPRTANPRDNASDADPARPATADEVVDRVEVVEVDNAEFLVGDLFRRRFNTDTFPEFPHHFVALARCTNGKLIPLGYCHCGEWQGNGLGGGLVIDERHYRRLPPSIRKAIRQDGGLAELLMREAVARMSGDLVAIWGYVGDKQAEKADLRVGFHHTSHPHIMVIWRRPGLTDAEKEDWLRRIIALGPF